MATINWEEQNVCDMCNTGPAENDAARADRFMALATAAISDTDNRTPVTDAIVTMREIERLVEAGMLWEDKP